MFDHEHKERADRYRPVEENRPVHFQIPGDRQHKQAHKLRID